MKAKIVLRTVLCCAFFCGCIDEEANILPEKEWIDVELGENFFTQENIEKLREAKARFNDFVYKDEEGNYKTHLKSGEEIAVEEETFNFLVKCLDYRRYIEERVAEIQMRRQSEEARSSPVFDPFEYYVLGQIRGIWDAAIKMLGDVSDVVGELIDMVANVCYINISTLTEVVIGWYTGLSMPQIIVPPFVEYPGPVMAFLWDGQCLGSTNAPDGVYAYPNYNLYYGSNPGNYIVVEDGMVWAFHCVGAPYSIYRANPKFFRPEHAYLLDPRRA